MHSIGGVDTIPDNLVRGKTLGQASGSLPELMRSHDASAICKSGLGHWADYRCGLFENHGGGMDVWNDNAWKSHIDPSGT